MRVLHIIVAGRDAPGDALGAAESLIASMASLAPRVEVGELDLGSWPEDGGASESPAEDGSGAAMVPFVLSEMMAAEVLVLTVPATGGIPSGLRWLAGLLRRPEARMARAADRRSGHRVSRRLVVVAGREGSVESEFGALLALVRDAFRVLDVVESGVITGQALAVSPGAPSSRPRRSAARSWVGHRDRQRPAAS